MNRRRAISCGRISEILGCLYDMYIASECTEPTRSPRVTLPFYLRSHLPHLFNISKMNNCLYVPLVSVSVLRRAPCLLVRRLHNVTFIHSRPNGRVLGASCCLAISRSFGELYERTCLGASFCEVSCCYDGRTYHSKEVGQDRHSTDLIRETCAIP